ncbi:hypothetical protein [Streptomyces sp. WMMB303]|uniref:hypothetical protein n=1 Tax=Streptomyces sp. WMMB303 TaxID=3034154 RepID=UPI0023EBDAAC|nr:hypothetical protein [Streptomyces sp. WMMB303]MDF4254620.1 hypothetical protein [Streptomyces sp. WMMB303]
MHSAADLQMRYATRMKAFVAARLGTDYRLTTQLTEQVWERLRSSPPKLPTGDAEVFNRLAQTARETIASHYLAARTRSQPATPTAPAPLLSTTRLGVAA